MEGLVDELLDGARDEMATVAEQRRRGRGGRLHEGGCVESHRARLARIESGEQTIVGVNRFTETEPSPLTADAEGGILVRRPGASRPSSAEALEAWRATRDQAAVDAALAELARAAADDARTSCRRRSPRPRAGATTGEWSATLRDVFGEYRAPTGVGERAAGRRRRGDRRAARRRRPGLRGARRADEDPRRQAGARRALQRRRADRRARARRRHGGRLRRHPPVAGADRRERARGGRRRDRAVDPVGLAPAS